VCERVRFMCKPLAAVANGDDGALGAQRQPQRPSWMISFLLSKEAG
jgi:hypothetical protein